MTSSDCNLFSFYIGRCPKRSLGNLTKAFSVGIRRKLAHLQVNELAEALEGVFGQGGDPVLVELEPFQVGEVTEGVGQDPGYAVVRQVAVMIEAERLALYPW